MCIFQVLPQREIATDGRSVHHKTKCVYTGLEVRTPQIDHILIGKRVTTTMEISPPRLV